MPAKSLQRLNSEVARCRLCPRLVAWREQVAREKVARFNEWKYWGKPVPGFGIPDARLLVVGLAPAAHGANRTGRLFTGDRSGDWLYRALHEFGFATQPDSVSRDDGLRLIDCYITAAARCAPPQNKLLPEELLHCRPFLVREMQTLQKTRVIVGLGKIACDALYATLKEIGETRLARRPEFGHGTEVALNDRLTLIMSYHPSQQNTFTGRLTKAMFHRIFRRAKVLLG